MNRRRNVRIVPLVLLLLQMMMCLSGCAEEADTQAYLNWLSEADREAVTDYVVQDVDLDGSEDLIFLFTRKLDDDTITYTNVGFAMGPDGQTRRMELASGLGYKFAKDNVLRVKKNTVYVTLLDTKTDMEYPYDITVSRYTSENGKTGLSFAVASGDGKSGK